MGTYSVTISTDGTPGASISFSNTSGNGGFSAYSSTPQTQTGYNQEWGVKFTINGVNGCKLRLQFGSTGQWAGSYTEQEGTTWPNSGYYNMAMANIIGIEVIACNVDSGGGDSGGGDSGGGDSGGGDSGGGDSGGGGSDTWVIASTKNLGVNLVNNTAASYYCNAGECFLITFGCKYAGDCIISVQEQMGESVFCFISDYNNFNAVLGYPDDYLTIITSGNSTTVSVSAGATYYIYSRLSSIDNVGTAYIVISPPGDPSDPDNASGVICIRTSAGEWKVATPLIYTNGEWIEAKACLRDQAGQWQ